MEQDGIIVKEEGHAPWMSSMLVINKTKRRRKSNKKVQPNMDKGHICIGPRDLNTALKRVHHPMITTEEVANRRIMLLAVKHLFQAVICRSGGGLSANEKEGKHTLNDKNSDLQYPSLKKEGNDKKQH